MKSILKRSYILLIVSLAASAIHLSAAPFVINEDFVAYLKQTTNPHEFGLRDDGRFYPYSSPRGRQIGYAQPVTEKRLYGAGCTKAEAETQLRARAGQALADVTRHMAKTFPSRSFDTLSRKSQEILVDYAFSEGAENLSASFYETVISENWEKLFNSFIYLRWIEKGWPDTTKNKAFADRWLAPQDRLRPGTVPTT